jgi:hypothetical protein
MEGILVHSFGWIRIRVKVSGDEERIIIWRSPFMQNRKVLVVDDEMDMRIFISTLLETSGYKAIKESTGSG